MTHFTKHSTAKQAAKIALEAQVGQLILGHYSSRYDDLSLFEKEAKTIFDRVILGEAGKSVEIKDVPEELLVIHQN